MCNVLAAMAVGRFNLTSVIVLCLCQIILRQDSIEDSRISLASHRISSAERFYISQVFDRPSGRYGKSKLVRSTSNACSETSVNANKLLHLIQIGLVAEWGLLCGDISVNPGPFNLYASQCRNGLSLCHWNIQRLTEPKFEEISKSLTGEARPDCKLDILILTESFCDSKVPDSYYCIPAYKLYRKDRQGKLGGGILTCVCKEISQSGFKLLQKPRRSDRKGGGTALLFRDNISVRKVNCATVESFELSEYFVTAGSLHFRLALVYRPPDSTNHPVTVNAFIGIILYLPRINCYV